MPIQDPDLYGSAPDKSPVVLLLIDTINDLEFEGGEALLEHALPMAQSIRRLKLKASDLGIPAIYVNDNFGRWRSDFNALVRHCIEDNVRGAPIAELLQPGEEDYFVLKPKNSGFYSTNLDLLLKHLGAKTLILTGVAGNNCILFTAGDAYLRDYELIIPSDCVASLDPADNHEALSIMRKTLKADTRPSMELDLTELL